MTQPNPDLDHTSDEDDDPDGINSPGLADRMDMDPDGIEWVDDDDDAS